MKQRKPAYNPNIITRTSRESTNNRGVKHKQSCSLFTCFCGAAFRDTVFFPTTDLKHSDPGLATHRYPTRMQVAVAKHQLFVRVMREKPSIALHNNNQRESKKTTTPPYRSEWTVVAKSSRNRGEVSAPRPNRPDPGPEGSDTHRQQRHHLSCSLGFTRLVSEPSRSAEQTVSPARGQPEPTATRHLARFRLQKSRVRFQTWSIFGLDSVLCLAPVRST